MPIRRLKNENGNDVMIEVDDRSSYIVIKMTGPSSMTENIITRKEAQTLADLLNRALGEA
ncbi:MAG: hypothetical protein AB7G06_07945 [Bdellovibrionales bacterium]